MKSFIWQDLLQVYARNRPLGALDNFILDSNPQLHNGVSALKGMQIHQFYKNSASIDSFYISFLDVTFDVYRLTTYSDMIGWTAMDGVCLFTCFSRWRCPFDRRVDDIFSWILYGLYIETWSILFYIQFFFFSLVVFLFISFKYSYCIQVTPRFTKGKWSLTKYISDALDRTLDSGYFVVIWPTASSKLVLVRLCLILCVSWFK